ncbi:hypothetical protein EXIGLDRAFT_730989 [Exidia glandulosa HHB12029]|uniref:Zn(2)-C6 fungal-type domain-containing protein n=1 Tax=Exidia glandulosa HHB12029 TaxID=1314781 RepID=A0A165Q011_EXIGL|nr:hypothetical protein EXIGLDRAFT_730989 [Exidia glandulosa HHB12029]
MQLPETPLPPSSTPATANQALPQLQPGQGAPVIVNPNPRGGCWTCRVRRKKCDEEEDRDGKCSTCRRLKLDCLGWSVRRPDWMRDKSAVEEYKRKIKQQLMDQGMIRGQPKAGTASHHGMHPYNVLGHMPVWSQHAPHQHSLNRSHSTGSNSNTDDELSSGRSSSRTSDQYSPVHLQNGTLPLLHHSATDYMYSSSNAFMPSDTLPASFIFESVIPPRQHHNQQQQSQYGHAAGNVVSNGYEATSIVSYPVTYQTQPYEPAPQPQPQQALEQGPRIRQSLTMPSSLGPALESQVLYYFQRVRGFQYVFAGKDVTSTFCDQIAEHPRGAVTSAICSLSSLHNYRMRTAAGLSGHNPGEIPDRRFYEDALWQIMQSKQATGQYSQTDATAAVHAISYWLFQGGSGQWEAVLNVAREWFANSPVSADENPVLPLIKQDDKAQFASRATMWMDIFSSISTKQSPRFLEVYRRLFRGVEGYWSSSIGLEHNKLRMDGLMGCPDEVMLTIAEAANLANWADRKRSEGKLSVRELVARADAIERELRTQEALRAFETSSSRTDFNEFDRLLREPLPEHETGSHISSASSSASSVPSPGSNFVSVSPMASMPGSNLASPMPPVPPLPTPSLPQPTQEDEMRAQVSKVFRESAILYLYTVMSGPHPRVPEIVDAVASIIESLKVLPASQYDRSLVFPICIAGCMTDDLGHREFLRNRLLAQDPTVGNVAEARMVMEAVWQRRDKFNMNAHWLDVMKELGYNLLLV